MSINGILLVDKPVGWTSFDVVNKVRGVIAREIGVKPKTVKVGHSGTLDPMATGLLILAVGSATKQMSVLSKLDKVYEVQIKLGVTSDTGDREGELKKTKITNKPSLEEVRQAVESYLGEINQTPPKYSAIKVDGVRAYKRARRGEEFKLKPRKVKIHQINDMKYRWPLITFSVEVSSGTYIRSLVEDIGKSLETGAYMSQLRRLKVGKYDIGNSIDVDQLSYEYIVQSISPLD